MSNFHSPPKGFQLQKQLKKQETTGEERILQQNLKTGSFKKNLHIDSDHNKV